MECSVMLQHSGEVLPGDELVCTEVESVRVPFNDSAARGFLSLADAVEGEL